MAFDTVQAELHILRSAFRQFAALHLSDDWMFAPADSLQKLTQWAEGDMPAELYCTDVAGGGLRVLRDLRRANNDLLVTLIVDAYTSPADYIKPGILASDILIRPFNSAQAERMMDEVFSVILYKIRKKTLAHQTFLLKTREKLLYIPYENIICFEARAKKIVLCTAAEEYAFYTTLDALESQLPPCFLRCHKGFIVNGLLVKKYAATENLLYLHGDVEIPVSRSYKAHVKEALQ